MTRSSFSSFASAVIVCAALTLLSAQPAPQPSADGDSLLAQAAKAEADLRFEIAKDRLYQLLIRQPGTSDAPAARLRLARLLALSGDLTAALLECQLLRDELPATHALREPALGLATTLARRLRAASAPGAAYFPTFEPLPGRGVQALGEPRVILPEGEGRFVVFDRDGPGRVYRLGPESATQVPTPQDPGAIALAPDGALIIAGKAGVVTVPASKVAALTGTWGGRAGRQVRKVQSMAALSTGDVLAIDEDYDGLLRCQLTSAACVPVGPPGKYRVVKVGVTDWIYLLDERGQNVRVLDAALRPVTTIGPMLGGARLERVEDIAVDAAHGLYLVDRDTKRLHVISLRSAPDGGVSAMALASIAIPQEGDQAMKRPTAIGVGPSGILAIAGESSPRVMRYR